MLGQKMVHNDAHDGSFDCYWQANILSLSRMQHKYSPPLSQRDLATRLWYKETRHQSQYSDDSFVQGQQPRQPPQKLV